LFGLGQPYLLYNVPPGLTLAGEAVARSFHRSAAAALICVLHVAFSVFASLRWPRLGIDLHVEPRSWTDVLATVIELPEGAGK
jgi:hypothetical protein